MSNIDGFVIKRLADVLRDGSEWQLKSIMRLQQEVVGRAVPCVWEGVDRILNSEDHTMFLVICLGEEIVGMVQGTVIHNLVDSKVFVDSVAVFPRWRSCGIGQRLMRALAEEAAQQWPSVTRVMLTSSEKRGTRAFYEGLGYTAREGERATVVYEYNIPIRLAAQ